MAISLWLARFIGFSFWQPEAGLWMLPAQVSGQSKTPPRSARPVYHSTVLELGPVG